MPILSCSKSLLANGDSRFCGRQLMSACAEIRVIPALARLVAVLLLFASALAPRAHASEPHTETVTCESSWPNNVHPQDNNIYKLTPKTLPGGQIKWSGRFKMYSPRGNEKECRVRQILFLTNPLVNDVPQGSSGGPVITVVVQHGLFHCRAKDFVLDPNFQPQHDGPITFYTVDAQAKTAKKGSYYAKISVTGTPVH